MKFKYVVFAGAVVLTTSLAWANTWDGVGSAEAACRAKIDETGAYRFSHVEISGDVGRCYTKAKDGDSESTYAAAVFKDEPPPQQENKDREPENAAAAPAAVAQNDKKSANKKDDICKEVKATFDATLAKDTAELPPDILKKAVVIIGVIVAPDGGQQWVGGASKFKGAAGDNFDVLPSGKPSGSKIDYFAHGIAAGTPSNILHCVNKSRYVYAKSGRPLEGHAEAKILEDWFMSGAAPGSTLYMDIRGRKQEPCPECSTLIQFVNAGGKECPKVQVCSM